MDPQQQVFNQMIYMLIQQGKPYVEAMNEASDIISGFIPFKSSFDEAKKDNYVTAAVLGAADLAGGEIEKGIGKAFTKILEKDALRFSEKIAANGGGEGFIPFQHLKRPTVLQAKDRRGTTL